MELLNKKTILYLLFYIILFIILYHAMYIIVYKVLFYFSPIKMEGFRQKIEDNNRGQT